MYGFVVNRQTMARTVEVLKIDPILFVGSRLYYKQSDAMKIAEYRLSRARIQQPWDPERFKELGKIWCDANI